jgi:short-subunit dehydrogenase
MSLCQKLSTNKKMKNTEKFSSLLGRSNESAVGLVVWITGASSGIGEELAYQYAKEGAILVLSARREDELLRVKKNMQLPDYQVFILPLDIEKANELPQKVAEVIKTFGRIDILINNAGISQRSCVLETDFAVYLKIMNINFFGVVALTKAVLPIMIAQKSGKIAVTSSLSGKFGTKMRSGYCASKHALHGFFDSLRAEVWQENIQITLICPGYIKTNISVNAINADGGKHGKMDENQSQGMPVEECARRIIKAIKQGKQEVYMGGKEVLGVYLKRFLPSILSRILRKTTPN